MCVCNNKQLMLFDFLRLAIQANSCHLRSEANRLVIDVSQVLCLWARGHQHKTLRFLQDSVRRGFILGKGKRKRKKKGGIARYLLVSTLLAARLHGLPGLARAMGNQGRSLMNLLPCWQKVARSPHSLPVGEGRGWTPRVGRC